MRTRVLIAVAAIGLLVVAFSLFRFSQQSPGLNTKRPELPSASDAQTGGIVGGGTVTFKANGQVVPTEPATADQGKPMEDKEFQTWLTTEAKNVDKPSLDGEQAKAKIAKIASHLTESQARHLLQTVKSDSSSAGEKILSTYILVEAGGLAQSEMKELITSALENRGPSKPHSEAEMRSVQDRSLRLMAIDGLGEHAKTDANARATLAQSIPGIQDPYIRKYAEQRLKEATPH